MNTRYTYNKAHKVQYIIKHGAPALQLTKDEHLINNDEMIQNFLEAYGLTPATFLLLDTEQKFQNHLKKVEKNYYADAEEMKLFGIVYLNQQKQKHGNNTDEDKREFIRQQNRTILNVMISNYKHHPKQYDLPLIQWTKHMLLHQVSTQRYQKALNHTLLVIVQQGFSSVIQVIKGILDLGFPAQNLVVLTKPHTSSPENIAAMTALQAERHFHYIEPDIAIAADRSNFKALRNDSMNRAAEVIDSLLRHNRQSPILANKIQHVAIHDEGGKLIEHDYFRNILAERFPDLSFSSSEHTVSGLKSRQKSPLPGPCFSMARSWLKAVKESYLIAEASFKTVKQDIDALIESRKPEKPLIAVVGIGNIGRHFLDFLMTFYPIKIKLVLADIKVDNPKFLEGLQKAQHLGMLDTRICEPQRLFEAPNVDFELEDYQLNTRHLLSKVDMLFGCSGHDISKDCETTLDQETPHEVAVYSLSSGQREFHTILEKHINAQHVTEHHEFKRSFGALQLTIKNYGEPIIFGQRKDAVEPEKIQMIRALTICTIFEQLEYLSLVSNIKLSDDTIMQNHLKTFSSQSGQTIQMDIGLQLSLWEAFSQFQESYFQSQNQDESNQLFKQLWQEFIAKKPDLAEVMENSDGKKSLSIGDYFSQMNLVRRFDKNHTLHLYYHEHCLKLMFCKHGKPVHDLNMLKSLLKDDLNFDAYCKASVMEQLNMLSPIAKRNCSRHQMFKPENFTIPDQDKYGQLTLQHNPS
jgi:hypothetical protein